MAVVINSAVAGQMMHAHLACYAHIPPPTPIQHLLNYKLFPTSQ